MATAVTIGELRGLIERFADALETNSADRAAVAGLRNLCAMFSGQESTGAAPFLKAVGPTPGQTAVEAGQSVSSVETTLASLRVLVDEVARKDLNKSLDSLLDTLRTNGHMPIAAFVAHARQSVASASKPKGKKAKGQMDQRLIDSYVKRLESALGNDSEFNSLLEELRADQRIAESEVAAIASHFYGRSSSRTTRAKALGRIRERHEKLMQFKRHPSTAGRPAA